MDKKFWWIDCISNDRHWILFLLTAETETDSPTTERSIKYFSFQTLNCTDLGFSLIFCSYFNVLGANTSHRIICYLQFAGLTCAAPFSFDISLGFTFNSLTNNWTRLIDLQCATKHPSWNGLCLSANLMHKCCCVTSILHRWKNSDFVSNGIWKVVTSGFEDRSIIFVIPHFFSKTICFRLLRVQ